MHNICQLISIWSLLGSVSFIWRNSMLLCGEPQHVLGRHQAVFCGRAPGWCREWLGEWVNTTLGSCPPCNPELWFLTLSFEFSKLWFSMRLYWGENVGRKWREQGMFKAIRWVKTKQNKTLAWTKRNLNFNLELPTSLFCELGILLTSWVWMFSRYWGYISLLWFKLCY